MSFGELSVGETSFRGIVHRGKVLLGNFHRGNVQIPLLEVLKGWTNPIDHRESLIYIFSCVEASHTVQNELLSGETAGLEELKRFWDERLKSSGRSFYSSLKKYNLSTFKHIAVKVVIKRKICDHRY